MINNEHFSILPRGIYSIYVAGEFSFLFSLVRLLAEVFLVGQTEIDKLNLECNQEVTEIDDKGVGKVSFKSISFRADERLKKVMKRTKIYRSNLKPHSMPMSSEEIETKLTEHFTTNAFITRREFQFLCQLLKPTACRVIKRLVEEGKLKNIASAHSPVYMPVEGHYGK